MVRDSHQIPCRILPIIWTRTQFEQRHRGITAYAKELIEKNSAHSIDVDKEDVIPIWWLLVDRLFPKGDPDRDQYMSQRDNYNEAHEQQDHESFQRAQRPTTRGERRAHPGVVVLVKDGFETLVPGIDFATLKDLKYQTFAREVLQANPTKMIALPEMQLLWDTIVYKVFRFECSCAKESKANESMGIDGFNQTQYDQLVSDVTSGVPRAPPTLFSTLPIPRSKRPREIDSNPETDGDDSGAVENGSPIVQRQKRRSKRAHRSGPGDSLNVPSYPSLPSAKRSAPIPRGQLPPLSETFTKPATAPHPAPESENEWLDPQLLAESTIQATGKFPGSSSDTSMVPGLKELDNVGGGSRREDNVDEETGA